MAALRRNFKKNPEVRVGKREENTIVFMEISIGPRKVGRLEIELRRDLCPLTCENFRQLITGERGTIRETDEHGNSECINLHYKGSRMCRVVRDSHCQGGDIKNGNGTWSRSIFKRGDFPDENFILRHTGAGCLSMCNRGLDSNGSQFFFTFAAKPEWDERHVVFGVLRNRESLRTLFAIDQVGSQFGKPSQAVWNSTSEAGYCHRADAVTGTTSRRWRRTSTPSSRRSYRDNVALMA